MNWRGTALWGFVGTVVLTGLMSGSHGLGLTRMSLPYMLGTMFTANRDRAQTVGVAIHLLNGWVFSLVYVAAFHVWGGPAWWKGALVGCVHAVFVLTAGMVSLPGLHPRMAGNTRGPTVVRQLEPPGFMALNYGRNTPIAIVVAHVAFGIILGGFYTPLPLR